MATPPHSDSRGNGGPAPRRVELATAAVRHARPRRALRGPLPASSWVLNGVAIGIAVLLAPVLTASSATVAVPRPAESQQASPTAVPTYDQRFATEPPQEVPDRSTDRDAIEFDDTLAPPPPGKAVKSNGTDFVSPVPGAITGGYGQRFHPILHYWRMHNGVDMHAGCGTVVIAAFRGTVIEAGPNGGYGNLVVIDHGRYNGKHVISKYAHLSRIGVRVGETVDTAQGIALSGTTGLSTGCHLHFEIKENGVYVDPAPYLTGKPSPRPNGPIKNLGPTNSPSPTPSATTSGAKPTRSPSPSASAKPTTTAKPTPKPTPTTTPTPTPTPSETATPTPSPSPSESESPEPTPTKSERSPEPSPSPSEDRKDPEPTRSASQRTQPSADPSPSDSATP